MVADSQVSIEQKSDQETSEEDISTLIHEEKGTPAKEQRLVDADVFEVKQPARPIYKSIPLKAGVAAVFALFLLVPIIGVFSGNILSGSSKNTKVADAETVESKEESARRLAEEENAELKRQLALQNQSFTAEEMKADAARNQQASAQETQTPQLRQTRSTATAARPPAPERASAPRATTRTSPASRPVVQRPPTTTARAAVSAQSRPQSRNASAREDSSLDMSVVAAAGNYGELPSASIAQRSSANPTGFPSERPAFQTIPISSRTGAVPVARAAYEKDSDTPTDSGGTKRPVPNVMQDDAEIATELALQTEEYGIATVSQKESSERKEEVAASSRKEDLEYEEDVNAIMNAPVFDTPAAEPETILPSRLLPGSAAQVSVLNSLTWASDLPRALGSVVLSEPLSSDGYDVLPIGTEMIVQIEALSESGAVAMDVVAIVLPGRVDAIALNIPEGAIAILDPDGGYPVAQAENSSEAQMRKIDRQQAMLGALSGIGNYLNRPERETSIFGVNGSSFSREFGNGSIAGSILSGAANEMLRSRSSRLDGEADEVMERPTIWSIEKGRALQIFITQEVAL